MISKQRFSTGFLALSLLVAPAWAGSVTGTIKFEGTPPAMKAIDVGADPVCSAHKRTQPIQNEALVLGEGQTMANVLVEVSAGLPEKSYPAPTEPAILTQEGCQYAPHVLAVQVGQTVKVMNPDGTLHNVNGMPKVNTPFNFGMPRDLKEKDIVFDKAEGLFSLNCSVHPWMRSYCAVISHPFFAVTGTDGKFSIAGLEPGEYEIRATHEKLGPQVLKVTVAGDTPATADFTFAMKK